VPLPQSAGDFAPPYVNAGKVENTGFEFAGPLIEMDPEAFIMKSVETSLPFTMK
jgi:hypothetical protein